MSYNIRTIAPFDKDLKRLSKRYESLHNDLLGLVEELKHNPYMGTDLGNGVHKIRLSITSKRRGKSGGARVITYTNVLVEIEEGNIYLLSIYDKSEQSTISDKQIKALLQEIIEK